MQLSIGIEAATALAFDDGVKDGSLFSGIKGTEPMEIIHRRFNVIDEETVICISSTIHFNEVGFSRSPVNNRKGNYETV